MCQKAASSIAQAGGLGPLGTPYRKGQDGGAASPSILEGGEAVKPTRTAPRRKEEEKVALEKTNTQLSRFFQN